MGRKRKGRALDVYVGSSKVGNYSREPSSATSFRYDRDWLSSERAFPISLSMPLSDRVWSGDTATNYFDGLLPDDRAVREKIAALEHAESAGIFDLLAVIGRDCVGALRFVPEGLDPGDPTKMTYRVVGDREIATRIASLATAPLGVHINEDDFRISIAGVQEKTAFLRVYQPTDSVTLAVAQLPASVFEGHGLVRSGPFGLQDEPMGEDAWVAEFDGREFVCTRRPRLRMLEGVLAFHRD